MPQSKFALSAIFGACLTGHHQTVRIDGCFPFEGQRLFQFVVRTNIRQLFAIEDTCGMKGTHYNRFTRRVIRLAHRGIDLGRDTLKLLRIHRQVLKDYRADSLGRCVTEALTNRARLAG